MHRSQNLAAGSSALILPELQLGDQVAIIAATISMVSTDLTTQLSVMSIHTTRTYLLGKLIANPETLCKWQP